MKINNYFTMWIGLALCTPAVAAAALTRNDPGVLLRKGREAFYAAVERRSQVDTALAIFEELSQDDPAYHGLTTTYIGALYTLKGKHAFLPQRKFEYVRDGLQIMQQGLEQTPENLEALFIYGMTCHYLPFFFGRGDDARQAFNRILGLLESEYQRYDKEMVLNVVRFFKTEISLTDQETRIVQDVEAKVLTQ